MVKLSLIGGLVVPVLVTVTVIVPFAPQVLKLFGPVSVMTYCVVAIAPSMLIGLLDFITFGNWSPQMLSPLNTATKPSPLVKPQAVCT